MNRIRKQNDRSTGTDVVGVQPTWKEMKCNTDLDPDEVTFNTLLDGCARYGFFDRGCEVLQATWTGTLGGAF